MQEFNLRNISPGTARNSVTEASVDISTGPLEFGAEPDGDWNDLFERDQFRHGLLYELKRVRLLMREGGQLQIRLKRPANCHENYERNFDALLVKAGFRTVSFQGNTLQTVKRPLIRTGPLEHRLSVCELEQPEDIEACHEFARDVFYYKDLMYDTELRRQFDPNSDYFGVFDENGEMLSVLVAVSRLPEYFCPFQYGETADGLRVSLPGHYGRVDEIMIAHRDGKVGVSAYKLLMKTFFNFLCEVAHPDAFVLCCEEDDRYTAEYYKNKFLMAEIGVRLTYRNSGTTWNVLLSDRMEEFCPGRAALFE